MTRGSLRGRVERGGAHRMKPGPFGDRKGKKNLDRETREPETMSKIPRPQSDLRRTVSSLYRLTLNSHHNRSRWFTVFKGLKRNLVERIDRECFY